jgi:hypothetical protein
MEDASPSVWDRVEEMVDRAPSVRALYAHRLHLLAAALWRRRGQTIAPELRAEERRAATMALAVPLLLGRARAAYPGPLMLMKGPEAAAHYPDPGTRYFRDLDLLTDDAPTAQRALVAAGFIEVGDRADYVAAQHLCPLAWPGLPLIIEVHREPNRPPWLPAPPAAAILELAVPSATGASGIVAPAPGAHALLLAGHVWSDKPLGRLIDLVDIAALLGSDDRSLAGDLALAWGWDGMWQTTLAAADALMADGHRPRSLSTWARNLEQVRERTVLEDHLARVTAPAGTVPLRRVPACVTASLGRALARRSDERWADKLGRSRLALTHALMARSEHERTLP